MKFFKIRYIFLTLLVFTLTVASMLYVFGGLKASAFVDRNIAFNEQDFIVDMQYLQRYNRKISFDSRYTTQQVIAVEAKLKERYASMERTSFYGKNAIFVNLGVGTDELRMTTEMHTTRLIVTRELDSLNATFQVLSGEPNHFRITLVTDHAKSKISTIITNLTALLPGPVSGHEAVANLENTEITVTHPESLIRSQLSQTILGEIATINTIIASGGTPNPEMVARVEAARASAIARLNDRAESIARAQIIEGVLFHSSIFELEKIVAQNDKYTMFFNEENGNVSVGVNETAEVVLISDSLGNMVPLTDEDGYIIYRNFKTIYKTSENADGTGNNALVMYYYGSNGTVSATGYGTFTHSIQYYDLVQRRNTRHYSMNYDVENGFDILFDIGAFTNINSFFPLVIDRDVFEDYVRGNFWFFVIGDQNTAWIKDDLGRYQMRYNNTGVTTSRECAIYLEENGLAKATEQFSIIDPTKSLGHWMLTDLLYTEEEVEDDPNLDASMIGVPRAQIGVHYNTVDPEDSPCRTNPFLSNREYSLIFSENAFSLVYNEPLGHTQLNNLHYVEESPLTYRSVVSRQGNVIKNGIYDYLYNISDTNYYRFGLFNDPRVDDSTIIYFRDEPVQRGGIHARDEDGNFLYDEDGKPVRAPFPKDVVEEQNVKHGNDDVAENKVFRLGLRYQLTDRGLELTVIDNAFIEGRAAQDRNDIYAHDYKVSSLDILPNFTRNTSETSVGEIIIPDGSGAVISFNSEKDAQDVSAFSPKPIYGLDMTFTRRERPDPVQNIMLAMYGFLDHTEKKGVVAIVDRGASQSRIGADFKRKAAQTSSNYAFFQTSYRASEIVYAGSGYFITPFNKWTNEKSNIDFRYVYSFINPIEDDDGTLNIDHFTYVEVANVYRDYLIRKYELTPKDATQENVVNLNFLGAFEKRSLFFGIVYDKDYSLTTFKQAQAIIEELQSYGINQFNVSYTAWTDDGMLPQATTRVKVADILGGTRDFKSFASFLAENQIQLYPEVNVATNYGYSLSYGNLKYTAKSVGSTYSQHWPYVLPTGRPDRSKTPLNMLSPRFYESLVDKFMQSYARFDVDGVFLTDLGNQRVGDYARNVSIFPGDGVYYQHDAMSLARERATNVMLRAPFDYAFQYASTIVDAPLTSTLLPIFDYSIPLYQLVLSGLVDYSGIPVNFGSQKSMTWFLLKSLETGSNLQFVLSYEDTNTLLDTDYTYYYNAYYINWKSKIISMHEEMNRAGVHTGRLVNHEYVTDNVVRVHYDNGTVNGVTLLINYANIAYVDPVTGIAVAPNWYVRLNGGV